MKKIMFLLVLALVAYVIYSYDLLNVINNKQQVEIQQSKENIKPKPVQTKKIARTANDYFHIGKQREKEKKFNSAIENYTKAIELDPCYWEAYEARATVKDLTEDFDGAKDDYSKSIELKRRIIQTKINMPYDELQQDIEMIYDKINSNKYLEAINLCKELIEKNPYYTRLYSINAEIYYDLKDYKNLIKCYSKIIDITPDDYQVYLKRAEIYYVLKQYQLAVNDYFFVYNKNINLREGIYYDLLNSLIHSENFNKFSEILDRYMLDVQDAIIYANDFYEWESILKKYSYNNEELQNILSKVKQLTVIPSKK